MRLGLALQDIIIHFCVQSAMITFSVKILIADTDGNTQHKNYVSATPLYQCLLERSLTRGITLIESVLQSATVVIYHSVALTLQYRLYCLNFARP